ncbi:MAG: bifunctional folylpolyglutamate synthase/dihydrofolate synthase [Chitinispirillales bacterium]|jgi:dihydrofolate synthase/folylpolyglutamate synthase|nr:bifunctional folylpolyglutamate synthase/dihydrofolate synthase [Chitinispirillales bacterium]
MSANNTEHESDNANAIRSHLFSLVNKGIKYDLDRMYEAASLCGNPQTSYSCIHVAGTNGKGSTCAYIESVLRAAGYRTGLYTSPHIKNFEERFRINGTVVEECVWLEVYKDQRKIIDDLGLTFFEAATLMSFEIFRRAGVEYAVFETGMGGRLDATNIITPKVSVITKLALDHMEYLGGTPEKIAAEKLGIVKPKVPLVMAEPVDENIRRLALAKCKESGSELTFVRPDEAGRVECNPQGVSFDFHDKRYDLSLFGAHQVQNALLALNTLGKIREFDYNLLYDGMKRAALPGRFQIINVDGRTVVIDVGHNPDAAIVLTEALDVRFPGKSILFVVGMMKDKDTASVIEIFTKNASTLYFAKPQTQRAADPVDLCVCAEGEFGFRGRCVTEMSVAGALRRALSEAHPRHDIICVTGSFFTVAEALSVIEK